MTTNLTQASAQWATRPADERFWTLEEMRDACARYKASSVEASVQYADLRVQANGEDLVIVGKQNTAAQVGNYAFGQLCARAGAPKSYLTQLPATLAAQNLNHGLKHAGDGEKTGKLLFAHEGGTNYRLRAALSDKYERLWNYEVANALLSVVPEGWRVPPARPSTHADQRARPATEADVLKRKGAGGGTAVSVGDLIAPAGLYASDKDMFAFLVNEDVVIDDGTPEGLARGIFLWNSEVGDKAFGGMSFLYKAVCSNHIVWDASGVTEWSIRHVGEKSRAKAFQTMQVDITKYAKSSAKDEQLKVATARRFELGANKEEVLKAVMSFAGSKKIQGLTKDRLSTAFDIAEEHRDWYNVAPTTVWGMVQGLTELSQHETHADERTALDRASGKLMTIAF